MITKKFIEKVHNAFDELNYHETKHLNFDAFKRAAVKTLTHCKDLEDARDAIRMHQFCLKKWDSIEKMFRSKLHIFNQYDYEGNSLLSLVPDEEAFGTFYITNGINKKVTEIFVASHSFDDEMLMFDFSKGRYGFEDGNYYIKYSKMSLIKMKLFNLKNECLCNIVLSENSGIFLENNSTPYDLIIYDDFVGIYEREYIESLADTDIIDTEKLLADIEWDILEKNSDLGVAKLNIYTSDRDLEMFLFFAAATFLIFQQYQSTQTAIYSLSLATIRLNSRLMR